MFPFSPAFPSFRADNFYSTKTSKLGLNNRLCLRSHPFSSGFRSQHRLTKPYVRCGSNIYPGSVRGPGQFRSLLIIIIWAMPCHAMPCYTSIHPSISSSREGQAKHSLTPARPGPFCRPDDLDLDLNLDLDV
ncbi:hypothetical protein GE21DRAFT_1279323, partial [Neurospora crassa]